MGSFVSSMFSNANSDGMPMPMPFPSPGGGGFPGLNTNNGGFNGLPFSGAWASGGFNTKGSSPTTGFNFFNGTGSMSIPGGGNNFPAFQGPTLPGVNPGGTNNPFGTTTGGSTFNPTVFPGLPNVSGHDLRNIYGKDIGNALSQFLSSGAGFNPAVMQAQLNQALPLEARTTAKMMDMFGNTGNAYSSTAALGIGDFESQFNSALQGEFAQEYQQSVQNYLNVLMGVTPSAQQNKAQSPTVLGMLGDFASGGLLGLFGGQ